MKSKFIVANWKMHGTQANWQSWAHNAVETAKELENATVVLSVPALAVPMVQAIVKESDNVFVAVQDVHGQGQGAHTGCISAPMVADMDVPFSLVGHSERRDEFAESGALVNSKVKACLAQGVQPIVCFGEMGAERQAGTHLNTIKQQLSEALEGVSADDLTLYLAYEPVWAISTSAGSLGRQPSHEELAEVFTFTRSYLVEKYGDAGNMIPLFYGGSVKSTTVADALSVNEVDGVLVGGASLKNDEFSALIKNAIKL